MPSIESVESVEYESRGHCAVLRLDNPPVNGLSFALRAALLQGFERAAHDDRIEAIVVTGSASAFSAGGDIREFGKPEATRVPMVHALTAHMDTIEKPLIAAIGGYALGGGL